MVYQTGPSVFTKRTLLYISLSAWWCCSYMFDTFHFHPFPSGLQFISIWDLDSNGEDMNPWCFPSHMLHGAGIFTYLYPKKMPSFVGKYSSTMEHLGIMNSMCFSSHGFFAETRGTWMLAACLQGRGDPEFLREFWEFIEEKAAKMVVPTQVGISFSQKLFFCGWKKSHGNRSKIFSIFSGKRNAIYIPWRILTVLLYMVCHGSHQYTPVIVSICWIVNGYNFHFCIYLLDYKPMLVNTIFLPAPLGPVMGYILGDLPLRTAPRIRGVNKSTGVYVHDMWGPRWVDN